MQFFIPILIFLPFFRSLYFIYLNVRWDIKKKIYSEALIRIFDIILKDESQIKIIADEIDPVAGLGLEDVWIWRLGADHIRNNEAINKIFETGEIKSLIAGIVAYHGKKISETVLVHHAQKALVFEWSNQLQKEKRLAPVKEKTSELVKLLKSHTKSRFKELTKTESRESIHYRYFVTFYRKYTYNLYKTCSAIFYWFFPPVAYSLFKQRVNYFKTLEGMIEDLNLSDNTTPISLDNFEIGKLYYDYQTDAFRKMDINYEYFQNKSNRLNMWIFLLLIPVIGSLISLFYGFGLINFFMYYPLTCIALLINKIQLYFTFKKHNPKIILKDTGQLPEANPENWSGDDEEE